MVETLIEGFKEAILQACKEDGSMPDRARYATASEVFFQPRYIPNSKEEDLSEGGGSNSTQRSSLKCIKVVDYTF